MPDDTSGGMPGDRALRTLAASRKRAEATVARVAERDWKSDDDAWAEAGPMGAAEWAAGEAAAWELRLLAAVKAVLELAAEMNVEDGHYPDPGMPPVSRADRIRAAIEHELEGTSDDR